MIRFYIGAVPAELHYSFFLAVSMFLLYQQEHRGILFFAAVLLHELGHIAAMLWLKIPIEGLSVTAFGIALKRKKPIQKKLAEEILVYAAGPLVNFILAAVLFLNPADFMQYSAMVHLALGTVNMLPVLPLDGGHILELLLEHFCPAQAETVQKIIFDIIITGLLVLGAVLFLSQRSVSLILFAILLMLNRIRL